MITLMARTKTNMLVETRVRVSTLSAPKEDFYGKHWRWIDWWVIGLGLAIFGGASWALWMVRK